MKKFTCTLALLSLFSLAGCLEYTENVTLNKDGSGSTQFRFAVSKAYLQEMEEMAKMMAEMGDKGAAPVEQPTIVSSKEDIEAFFGDIKSGARLKSYEVSETDEFRVWNLAFTFTELSEIDHISASIFESEEDEPGSLDSMEIDHPSSVTFAKQDNGSWLFERSMADSDMGGEMGMGMDDEYANGGYGDEDGDGDGGYPDEYPPEEDDESDDPLGFGAGLEKAVGDFAKDLEEAAGDPNDPVFVFSVTFQDKVIESNASSIDGNTATWSFTMEQISASIPPMNALVKD